MLKKPKTPMEALISGMDELMPNVLHKCPFNGNVRITNMTYPLAWADLQWKGDFILIVRVYDDRDPEEILVKLFFTIKLRVGKTF